MSELRVRPLKLLEVPKWLKWLWDGKEKNDLDAKIFEYKTLRVYVCENSKPLVMVPVHSVAVLESLAFNPEATAKEKLDSVMETIHVIEQEAKASGISELLYVSSDERVDESAARHLGFVKEVMYRKVL
jgi:hypothetical protein